MNKVKNKKNNKKLLNVTYNILEKFVNLLLIYCKEYSYILTNLYIFCLNLIQDKIWL